MHIALRLINEAGELVHERPTLPRPTAHMSMIVFRGVHYSYAGLFLDNASGKRYASFRQSPPPYELPEE